MAPPSESPEELGPFKREPGVISFLTDGDWTADELGAALGALDRAYLAIMLARWLALDSKERAQRILDAWRGPIEDLRFFIRNLDPRAFPFLLGDPHPRHWATFDEDLVERCLEEPGLFLEPPDELVIERIQMASPGFFSLKGLGEPLKQLRELIKDIWYRNSQERELGELKIIRERLKLAAQFPIDDAQLQQLTDSVIADIAELKPLIHTQKLLLDGDQQDGPLHPKTRAVRYRGVRKRLSSRMPTKR